MRDPVKMRGFYCYAEMRGDFDIQTVHMSKQIICYRGTYCYQAISYSRNYKINLCWETGITCD
jgi:hypothetical protein